MAESETIIQVPVGDRVEGEIARRGPTRKVKLVPLMGPFAAPAIWTSDYLVEFEGKPAYVCIVLVTKNPAECTRITIPKAFYENLPEIPVEW